MDVYIAEIIFCKVACMDRLEKAKSTGGLAHFNHKEIYELCTLNESFHWLLTAPQGVPLVLGSMLEAKVCHALWLKEGLSFTTEESTEFLGNFLPFPRPKPCPETEAHLGTHHDDPLEVIPESQTQPEKIYHSVGHVCVIASDGLLKKVTALFLKLDNRPKGEPVVLNGEERHGLGICFQFLDAAEGEIFQRSGVTPAHPLPSILGKMFETGMIDSLWEKDGTICICSSTNMSTLALDTDELTSLHSMFDHFVRESIKKSVMDTFTHRNLSVSSLPSR
jgi:hypothetical protein